MEKKKSSTLLNTVVLVVISVVAVALLAIVNQITLKPIEQADVNQKAEIYKGLDTFISFYISSGEHEIEMHYEPEGLKAGLIISGISLLIFAAVIALELRKKKRAQSSAQENNNDRNSCNEIESVSDNEFCNEFCNEFQTNSCNGSCMDSSNKALVSCKS